VSANAHQRHKNQSDRDRDAFSLRSVHWCAVAEVSGGNAELAAKKKGQMTKAISTIEAEAAEHDSFCSTTTIAALLLLAAKFPHRQFNSAELSVLSGVGRNTMSQIKNAKDTLFSLGTCTGQRLDTWLAKHPRLQARIMNSSPRRFAMQRGVRNSYLFRLSVSHRRE
jgi:hypothetical protein